MSDMKYKVWVQIELIDEDNDIYEDYGMPDPIGTFDTVEDASNCVEQVLNAFNPSALDTRE